MDIEVLRLTPGADLRLALEGFIRERGFSAAFVITGVGSLRRAAVRYAGRTEASPLPHGCFEIIALSGTLAPDGCHLHAALADENGAVFGGHVLAGCTVHTTAEIVIGVSNTHRFTRRFDAATGCHELVIERDSLSS